MQRKSYGSTDIGRKRTSNEDAFFFDDELGLYTVADGMGGHAAGEIASHEAVDNVVGMVKRGFDRVKVIEAGDRSDKNVRSAVRLLESAVQAATYMVHALAQHDPDQKGMGTTLSALLLAGELGITAQVGDSRIYLIRNKQAVRLTEDHTLIAWQLKTGLISEQEAAKSPHKNVITRAVGSREYVQVDTYCMDVKPGDVYLLCSDGLHGYIEDHEIPELVSQGGYPSVERLIGIANQRGGRDNITVVTVEISP